MSGLRLSGYRFRRCLPSRKNMRMHKGTRAVSGCCQRPGSRRPTTRVDFTSSAANERPWSAARWIIARSASAVIVSSGLTPSERGIAAPSITYNPSCTAVEPRPGPASKTGLCGPPRLLRSWPMPQPPSGCAVAGWWPITVPASGFLTLSAGFARDRRQELVETAVDGLVAGPRPAELKPVVLQPEAARGAVVWTAKKVCRLANGPL